MSEIEEFKDWEKQLRKFWKGDCDVVIEIDMTIVKVMKRKDNFPIVSMLW